LNDIIFCHQRLAETLGKLPHLMIAPQKCLLGGGLPGEGGGRRVVGSLSEGHVPLLFRIVFNLDIPLLHTGRVIMCPMSDTTHIIEAVPSAYMSYLPE
jgi:hypothetical protein